MITASIDLSLTLLAINLFTLFLLYNNALRIIVNIKKLIILVTHYYLYKFYESFNKNLISI